MIVQIGYSFWYVQPKIIFWPQIKFGAEIKLFLRYRVWHSQLSLFFHLFPSAIDRKWVNWASTSVKNIRLVFIWKCSRATNLHWSLLLSINLIPTWQLRKFEYFLCSPQAKVHLNFLTLIQLENLKVIQKKFCKFSDTRCSLLIDGQIVGIFCGVCGRGIYLSIILLSETT